MSENVLFSRMEPGAARSRGTRRSRPVFKMFLGLLVLGLVALRLYLPTLVKNYLNGVLNKIPGYYGHIDDVRLHIWRGAYSIVGLDLLKVNGNVKIPFVAIAQTDFSIAWKPLFRGNLSGKVELNKPQINFVASKSDDKSQLSIDKSWQERAKELFPLRIARLGIKDGEVHFRNIEATPPVDVFIRRIFLVATNLTNSLRISKSLKATIDAQAIAMDSGETVVHVDLDPLVDKPTFAINFKMENLQLSQLNDFFKHYLAVEAKTGTFDLYLEGVAKQGQFNGYVKPLFERLDLIKMKEDASLGEIFKAALVKFVSYVFKNHKKDRLAVRIKITGTVGDPKPNVWSAITSFFHNWFINALTRGFEGKEDL